VTTQPGNDGGRPYGDPNYRPEVQPWDPAYPHPYPSANAYPYGYPYPGAYGPPPAPEPPRRARHRAAVALGVGALAAATVVGVAVANSTHAVSGTAITAAGGSSGSTGSSGGSSSGGSSGGSSTTPGSGTFPFPRQGTPGSGSGSNGSTGGATASSSQSVGVVDINTVQKYSQAAAAGTGMVLTSDGEILTNNHVIDGATSIKVTVVSTGKSYVAKVVGTVPTKDIAVIKLVSASGLKTANLGDSGTVSVGNAVTGVGNAGGTGGTPSAASGTVTALGRTITASDEDGSGSETLHGVIVTNAPIQAGDSGGPLYNSKGEVVGIDTAASTSGTSVGFAIPINTALATAAQIEKGVETSSVHIGYPGFLGISVSPAQSSGALVAGVLSGGPAADAGIGAGDVITKVGGTTIANSTQLQKAVSSHDPGSKVDVTYTDPITGSHAVTVTLATGPAD
jgi:S1-C subfamily serine protease